MQIFIRDAQISDMSALQGVFERASLSNQNDRALLADHPEWLDLSSEAVVGGRTRVAVNDHGAVVGFATVLIFGGLAELEDLFVDPPWMRQGIGAALVSDVSVRLKDLHFESFEVTANPHAMAFYQQLGFVEIGIVETMGYPALRMSRPTGVRD